MRSATLAALVLPALVLVAPAPAHARVWTKTWEVPNSPISRISPQQTASSRVFLNSAWYWTASVRSPVGAAPVAWHDRRPERPQDAEKRGCCQGGRAEGG